MIQTFKATVNICVTSALGKQLENSYALTLGQKSPERKPVKPTCAIWDVFFVYGGTVFTFMKIRSTKKQSNKGRKDPHQKKISEGKQALHI